MNLTLFRCSIGLDLISIKEGKEIHKLKLVTGMTSKSIDGVYHIYQKVKEEMT